jgi:excisionase family DNA binding protein
MSDLYIGRDLFIYIPGKVTISMENPETSVLLGKKRAADRLDVTTDQLTGRIKEGILPAVKVGKSWRIPAIAIDGLIETAMKSTAPIKSE